MNIKNIDALHRRTRWAVAISLAVGIVGGAAACASSTDTPIDTSGVEQSNGDAGERSESVPPITSADLIEQERQRLSDLAERIARFECAAGSPVGLTADRLARDASTGAVVDVPVGPPADRLEREVEVAPD
ncbi:hypothetical protein GCM10022200_07220 [Microbacterium awajiense]|uniref:Uncharacterized protein n=1 Tax=Microbacterium awajiense TaxID=415214 RepID=A0ABP7A9C8_9MICO